MIRIFVPLVAAIAFALGQTASASTTAAFVGVDNSHIASAWLLSNEQYMVAARKCGEASSAAVPTQTVVLCDSILIAVQARKNRDYVVTIPALMRDRVRRASILKTCVFSGDTTPHAVNCAQAAVADSLASLHMAFTP
jgi:hypothetical protein